MTSERPGLRIDQDEGLAGMNTITATERSRNWIRASRTSQNQIAMEKTRPDDDLRLDKSACRV
jgi:hypothetical protein